MASHLHARRTTSNTGNNTNTKTTSSSSQLGSDAAGDEERHQNPQALLSPDTPPKSGGLTRSSNNNNNNHEHTRSWYMRARAALLYQNHDYCWCCRPIRRWVSENAELTRALVAVLAFLSVGLFFGYFLLQHQHRKVIVRAMMRDPWAHGRALVRGRVGFRHHYYTGSPRFVTIVMPSVVNPAGRTRRLNAIQDTWGPGSRAIYVVHNVTEFPQASHAVISQRSSPDDPYEYPQLLLVPPDLDVKDGLPRLYLTLKTIYEKVDPDFAYFVNDHTYVIPEHLCRYLRHRDPDHDMYAGHGLKNNKDDIFNSGAAGYVLSRSTLGKLVTKFDDDTDPTCSQHTTNTWLQGNPGLMTVRCLQTLGIYAYDTRAASKWHRFHAFPLTRMVSGHVDEWYLNKHVGLAAASAAAAAGSTGQDGSGQGSGPAATAGAITKTGDTTTSSSIPFPDPSYDTLLMGVDCCSKSTISFHYVEAKETLALFSVRASLLKDPKLTDHELKAIILSEWPKQAKDLGGYSQGLPNADDRDGWAALLKTIRNISTRQTQVDC